jgi:hypothetical protein
MKPDFVSTIMNRDFVPETSAYKLEARQIGNVVHYTHAIDVASWQRQRKCLEVLDNGLSQKRVLEGDQHDRVGIAQFDPYRCFANINSSETSDPAQPGDDRPSPPTGCKYLGSQVGDRRFLPEFIRWCLPHFRPAPGASHFPRHLQKVCETANPGWPGADPTKSRSTSIQALIDASLCHPYRILYRLRRPPLPRLHAAVVKDAQQIPAALRCRHRFPTLLREWLPPEGRH